MRRERLFPVDGSEREIFDHQDICRIADSMMRLSKQVFHGGGIVIAFDTPIFASHDMITISRNMITRMEQPFHETLADYLAQRYAAASDMGRDALLDWVTTAMLDARRAGFGAEQHICDYVEASWRQGEGMRSHPDFIDVMKHKFSTVEDKAVRLRRRFVERTASRD